jgi:hypothetical protein
MVAVAGIESMNTIPFYRKREISPVRRACLSLGLNVDAKPGTNLAWHLRKAKLGNTAIEYLGLSDDDEAQRIVALYRSLKNATERKAVTIDYLVMAAGADVHHVSGVIQEEVSRMCGIKMGVLAHGVVLDALIKRARKPDGLQAQRTLFELCAPFWKASTPDARSRTHERIAPAATSHPLRGGAQGVERMAGTSSSKETEQ